MIDIIDQLSGSLTNWTTFSTLSGSRNFVQLNNGSGQWTGLFIDRTGGNQNNPVILTLTATLNTEVVQNFTNLARINTGDMCTNPVQNNGVCRRILTVPGNTSVGTDTAT